MAAGLTSGFGCGANTAHQISISTAIFSAMTPNSSSVNRRNGRSIVVRINDRGPFVHGRIIDLTPAGARALGFSGLAPVEVMPMRG